jgi:hypothetical protein
MSATLRPLGVAKSPVHTICDKDEKINENFKA